MIYNPVYYLNMDIDLIFNDQKKNQLNIQSSNQLTHSRYRVK